VLLDSHDRVLLVHFVDRQRGVEWWATPGGALERDETHEQAVEREVEEETGLGQFEVGPWIWTRTHVFPSRGITYRQEERFFLVRVPPFEARAAALDDGESDFFRSLRWWTVEELEATDADVAPAELPALLRMLLERGVPAQPLDVGV
jgi:8-oxo-dGTP pyrophosphatase MutT (NUDIX family)